MRLKVYISGPITKGDQEHNFNQAAEAHIALLKAGFAVFNPMLTMKLPGCEEILHADWLESDLPWIGDDTRACVEAVLRLPGESKGADIECRYAEYTWGIPVYYDTEELIGQLKGLTDA